MCNIKYKTLFYFLTSCVNGVYNDGRGVFFNHFWQNKKFHFALLFLKILPLECVVFELCKKNKHQAPHFVFKPDTPNFCLFLTP